jgi:hypothetical protein
MADIWSFGPPHDDTTDYSDGTVVPHREQVVYLNGEAVGEIEVHLHRRGGPDKQPDLSAGVTAITYGPLAPRETPDNW